MIRDILFDIFFARELHIDGLVQNCSTSSALAMVILQSCTKPFSLTANPKKKSWPFRYLYYQSSVLDISFYNNHANQSVIF